MDAKAVIVTVAATAAIDEIVRAGARAAQRYRHRVARPRCRRMRATSTRIGVTDAVPETIEASLQLSEAALFGLGRPSGLVIASIHEKRDEFRRELQQAAAQSPAETTRAIRPKTFRSH